MRRLSSLGAVMAMAAGVIVGTAGPAFAGGHVVATFVVVVHGSVPSGTTFTVHGTCSGPGGESSTATFDATGALMSAPLTNVVAGSSGQTCTITETQNGGAAVVSYSCVVVSGAICAAGNQLTNLSASASDDTGTITVINAFALPALSVSSGPTAAGSSATISGTGCTKALFGGSATVGGTVQVTVGFPTPVVIQTTAGADGAWSIALAVPGETPSGSYPVTAACDDPVPYPATSLTVTGAAATAATAIPAAATFTG